MLSEPIKAVAKVSFNKSEYRRFVSLQAAKANKRIARIEKNKLTESPAYKRLVENGKVKFGIKGKTFNEVQSELAKINKFLNSETSTVRGMNNVLKDMAKNTGIKYKNVKELQKIGNNFFKLADKVEEYLRNVDDIASAIGYQKIWEVINTYVETEKIDLTDAESQIDSMVESVTDLLKDKTTPKLTLEDSESVAWFY